MKNTLKPLPSFEASESSYVGELRHAFLDGYNEARKEFEKDAKRLDWLESQDGLDYRKAIDKEMEE
tara:strand:- start:922 stop:1119 length:198 start_codon:yes stop_codon:yes gene_type:complete